MDDLVNWNVGGKFLKLFSDFFQSMQSLPDWCLCRESLDVFCRFCGILLLLLKAFFLLALFFMKDFQWLTEAWVPSSADWSVYGLECLWSLWELLLRFFLAEKRLVVEKMLFVRLNAFLNDYWWYWVQRCLDHLPNDHLPNDSRVDWNAHTWFLLRKISNWTWEREDAVIFVRKNSSKE